jgi:2,4-dienoyl-CoA reductase (NADPH2)
MEGKPDTVIVAAGASPIIPNIRGIEKPKVVTALDALRQPTAVGERVVIIGGGLVACETAELLAQKGKKVTILEMMGRIANDVGIMTRRFLLRRLRESGIRMETNIEVEEITDQGVKGVRDDKSESFVGDTVVLALGMKANKELAEELKGKVGELYFIGDCAEPRKITEAIGEGFETGWRV